MEKLLRKYNVFFATFEVGNWNLRQSSLLVSFNTQSRSALERSNFLIILPEHTFKSFHKPSKKA